MKQEVAVGSVKQQCKKADLRPVPLTSTQPSFHDQTKKKNWWRKLRNTEARLVHKIQDIVLDLDSLRKTRTSKLALEVTTGDNGKKVESENSSDGLKEHRERAVRCFNGLRFHSSWQLDCGKMSHDAPRLAPRLALQRRNLVRFTWYPP